MQKNPTRMVIITAREGSLGQGNVFRSICLSTGGSLSRQGLCREGGGSVHGGLCVRETPKQRPPLYGKERMVRILLECILVTARKRSLGQGNIFTPVCHSVHGGGVCVVAPGGACVVALGGVRGCSGGGHAWLLWGGMLGCSGGHAWLLGGMCGCSGGVHGCSGGVCCCSRGACMVALGGMHGFIWGGMHGFIRGGVHGFIRGGCAWFMSIEKISQPHISAIRA